LSDPIVEPITPDLAKQQSRVDADFTADDTLFEIYCTAARQLGEKLTQRAFFNQTWRRTLDAFPIAASYDSTMPAADRATWANGGWFWNRETIDLPGGPIVRLLQIQYRDSSSGQFVKLDPSQYRVDCGGEDSPARVTPADGFSWPLTPSNVPGSVMIDYEPASYVRQVVEQLAVPAAGAPYTLKQVAAAAPLTAIDTIVDGAGNAVTKWTNDGAAITFDASLAGQALTATYCVGRFPALLTVALLMLTEHFYRNPGATTDLKLTELPLGVQSIISSHTIEWSDYRPC
jgi:hypothetical protein